MGMSLETWQQLIRLLADGQYQSGEALGQALGVSRTAIWKHLKKLPEQGVELESCKKRGYRIPGGLSLLCEDSIRAFFPQGELPPGAELDIQQVIASTNVMAMERSRAGTADGYICLAESQTGGKGRRGRTWVSPFGRNIYLSMVRRFEGGVAAVEGLSLAVGVAMVRALEELGISDAQVKWPNDILWRGRKLAGVLLEISGDPAGTCDVIVGVGLNVDMPPSAGEQVDQAWADLSTALGGRPDRNRVIASLLGQLLPLLEDFEVKGFAHYRKAWESLDAHRGQTVVLHMGERKIAGIASGVDDTGAICIETPVGMQSYSGGEISVRVAT